jgi:hypothetical protein
MKACSWGLLGFVLFMDSLAAGCASHDGVILLGGNENRPTGSLAGVVTRGPTCPVQTPTTPCPPEPASGMKLLVLTPTGEKIRSPVTNHEGKYRVALPAGSYRIEISPLTGIEFTKDVPATVTILEGRETRLDINIDTGIR